MMKISASAAMTLVRKACSRLAASVVLAVCSEAAIAQTPAASQSGYVAPRTSFGQPSLEGVWTANFILPLEATPQAPMLTLPEPAAKAMAAAIVKMIANQFEEQLDPEVPEAVRNSDGLAIVRGQRRTRAIIEPASGILPITPEARKELVPNPPLGSMDNYEERPNWERCIAGMGRAPVATTGAANPRLLIQTRDQFVFHTEYGAETRIIPYTDKHQPSLFHTALGDSIARWEGETLVIETIGMEEKDRLRLFPTMIVSGDAKVIERLTRIAENELLYQFTVVDPKVYTAPWLAEFSLYKTDQRFFEHACHEGNYSLPHILQGARVADAKAKPKQRR